MNFEVGNIADQEDTDVIYGESTSRRRRLKPGQKDNTAGAGDYGSGSNQTPSEYDESIRGNGTVGNFKSDSAYDDPFSTDDPYDPDDYYDSDSDSYDISDDNSSSFSSKEHSDYSDFSEGESYNVEGLGYRESTQAPAGRNNVVTNLQRKNDSCDVSTLGHKSGDGADRSTGTGSYAGTKNNSPKAKTAAVGLLADKMSEAPKNIAKASAKKARDSAQNALRRAAESPAQLVSSGFKSQLTSGETDAERDLRKGAGGAASAIRKVFQVAQKALSLAYTAFGFPTVIVCFAVAAPVLILVLCLSGATGADENTLTSAYKYITELDALFQERIYNESTSTSSSTSVVYYWNDTDNGEDMVEVNTNVLYMLMYLEAKYGTLELDAEIDGVYGGATIQEEIANIHAQLYTLSSSTRTETEVTVGDLIGSVVTSGYCPCSICCGQWENGITATGTTAKSSYTIAVDAYDPIVPYGTYVYMKESDTAYLVEDCGDLNTYGVDFDVYYDLHTTATNHGHKTWTAYYCTVTETHYLDVYVGQTAVTELLAASGQMTDDESELISSWQEEGYLSSLQYLSPPFECYYYASEKWGYYLSSTGAVTFREYVRLIPMESNATVYACEAGIAEVSGKTVTVSAGDGSSTKIEYGELATVTVNDGDIVYAGTAIGTANSSTGITFAYYIFTSDIYGSFAGETWQSSNPGFYLDGIITVYSGDGSTIVEVALNELGNTNGTKYKEWYPMDATSAWCACFVSWCADQCGLIDAGIFIKAASTNTMLNFFDSQGRYYSADSGYLPQAGDVIFFCNTYDKNGDGVIKNEGVTHVGIVVSCDGTTVTTVEGNSSNSVKCNSYSISYSKIMGYGVPAYE